MRMAISIVSVPYKMQPRLIRCAPVQFAHTGSRGALASLLALSRGMAQQRPLRHTLLHGSWLSVSSAPVTLPPG
jgi:hypothetical protein